MSNYHKIHFHTFQMRKNIQRLTNLHVIAFTSRVIDITIASLPSYASRNVNFKADQLAITRLADEYFFLFITEMVF